MPVQDACAAAGELLWNAWQRGTVIDALPDACRPATREEGYQVQSAIEARSAFPVFGWKVAATSVAGQRHIRVAGPVAGRLLRERAYASGTQLSLAGNRMAVAEPEFAFRMAHDLPPRPTPYSIAEVTAAIACVHPAIEVPDSRFVDFAVAGEAQIIADNGCAHEFVLGPAATEEWRRLDLSTHAVHAGVRGARRSYTRDGSGAAVLGSPLLALAWLANELRTLGLALSRDQVVTTGACMTPLQVQAGDQVTADFGGLGQVSAGFRP
jgi:2-keto-4-pentenoate hydratase